MSPSPKSAPSAVVGLDIGSDSIKIAEARFSKGEITITGLGVARTPEGAVENEVILDPQALGAAIKTLAAESGIKTKRCVSSVGGQSQVVIRVIEVPKMSQQELSETMKWEIERHVPFAQNEVVKDFQPLERPSADPDAQNMEVLLAVAQQDLIDNHVAALFAAGLQPMAIDIEPLAASRSLIEASVNGVKDETVAIVNIGSNCTDFGVFENGLLTFPSPPLSIAGVTFTREIAEAMGQTLDQAEVTKKEYAAVNIEAFAPAPAPEPEPDVSTQAAEPTAFNSVFSPQSSTTSAFDLDDASPADAAQDSGLAAEPADLSSFRDTVDGPVFDTPDSPSPLGSPAFDLGDTAPAASEPMAAPSFDLGEGTGDAVPVTPSFDLGEGDVVAADPSAFDLGGEQPEAATAATPDFDLDEVGTPEAGGDAQPMAADEVTGAPEQPVFAQAPLSGSGQARSIEDIVFDAISGVLVDLANELRRSLEYYSGRYSKMPQRVILCGGTAKMPKLDEFLSQELGIPVEVADPVKNLRVNVQGASSQYLKEISPLFSVSIGLAIRDMVG